MALNNADFKNQYVAQPVTAQPVGQPQYAQAQPQIVYAQPVQQQPPQVVIQQQRPVERVVITNERYCGPITALIGLLLFLFIGPFAIFVILCPCDEMPRQQVYIQR